jgi:hypothetical protein
MSIASLLTTVTATLLAVGLAKRLRRRIGAAARTAKFYRQRGNPVKDDKAGEEVVLSFDRDPDTGIYRDKN